MPPPAVKHARPSVIVRWWRAYAVAIMAGLVIPAVFRSAIGTLSGGPSMALTIAALALQYGCIVWMVVLFARYLRITRALRTRPLPCLHCLYPLMLDQPTCPECGRLQNRHALSDPWKKRLQI